MHDADQPVDEGSATPDAATVTDTTREAHGRRSPSRRRRTVRLRDRLRRLRRIVPRRAGARLSFTALVCVIGGFVVISARNDVPVRLAERATPDVVPRSGTGRGGADVAAVPTRPLDSSMASVAPMDASAPGDPSVSTADAAETGPPAVPAGTTASVPDSSPGVTPARRATPNEAPTASPASAVADVSSLDALRERLVAFDEPIAYTVNEGGSLWRTARRIVDGDEALLGAFVDALSASGMRVGRVRAGQEVVVERGVERGHRLRVDDRDAVYVSRLVDGAATTSAYRIVTVAVRTGFERDAAAAGVPEAALEGLSASDASSVAALADAAGGTIDVLYLDVFGDDDARPRLLAVATDAGVRRIGSADPGSLSRDGIDRLVNADTRG